MHIQRAFSWHGRHYHLKTKVARCDAMMATHDVFTDIIIDKAVTGTKCQSYLLNPCRPANVKRFTDLHQLILCGAEYTETDGNEINESTVCRTPE